MFYQSSSKKKKWQADSTWNGQARESIQTDTAIAEDGFRYPRAKKMNSRNMQAGAYTWLDRNEENKQMKI